MLGICSLGVLVLHETLLIPVFTYSSETILWKENERSRIRAVDGYCRKVVRKRKVAGACK